MTSTTTPTPASTDARHSPGGRPSSRPARRRLSQRRREQLAAWLFVAPDTLGLLVFVVTPMLLSFGLGLYDVSGFGAYTFVGLENYQRMLEDPQFLDSLQVTGVYVVGFVVGVFVVSLGLALLVKQRLPLVRVLRSMFFLPHVVSLVVIALVWQFMLLDGRGLVNKALAVVGLPGASWLGDPALALPTVIAVSIWFFMGYYMIIFVAALQDIPQDYYDAARLDGAGSTQTFRHVTWPLLKPTSFFVLVVSIITGVAGLQVFDLIYVMTNGGPARSTTLAIFYIYEQAFQFNDYGYASAMASTVIFLLVVVTGSVFALTRGGRFDVN